MARRQLARRMLAAVVATSVGLSLSTAARTQTSGGTGDFGVDIVVRADRGPALWRVTRGDAELVLVGSVSPTPRGRAWNTAAVAAAVQGARALLLSPGSTPGFAWGDDFGESQRFLLDQPFGRTLVREVGVEVADRFTRLAAALHRPLTPYNSYRPAPGGMRLLQDSWSDRGFTGSEIDGAVIALAKRARVRVVKVDEGSALPLINAMVTMTREQQAACFGEALDQIEREGAQVEIDFRAWAQGDVAALRNGYRPVKLCFDSVPGGTARRAKAQAAWLRALIDALNRPGRTVALMDVSDLLRPSDLLAALTAQGAVVIPPHGEASAVEGVRQVVLQAGAPLDVFDAAPEGLRVAKSQPASASTLRSGATAGRNVTLQDGDVSCVTETAVGSTLPRTICHTRSEWREINAERARAVETWAERRRLGSGFTAPTQ